MTVIFSVTKTEINTINFKEWMTVIFSETKTDTTTSRAGWLQLVQ